MGVKIPMRDGTNLAATVYKPKNMQKPLPVILHLTCYIADGWSSRGLWYARRGYVSVAVDSRGRGNSEGKFKPFVNEGRDGYDCVQWIAGQPWCDGKVAMIGGSYTGWDQWTVIKEFPPHLESIWPAASAYPGTEGVPKNRNINLPYIMVWLTTTSGRARGPSLGGTFWDGCMYEMYRNHLPFNTLDKICGNTTTEFQTWLKHPAVDAYWDAMNPSIEDYARIDKPIMTVTGYFDADQTGAMTHYRLHMQHASPEAREKHYLIIGPWDHGGAQQGKSENAGLRFDNAVFDHNELHRQWYDWTLKDGKKPEFLKKRVAYYVMGAEQWKYADSLEAIPTTPVRMYLDSSGDGANDIALPGILSKKRPSKSTSDKYTYDPLDTRPGEVEMKLGGEPGSYNIMYYSANTQRYALNFKEFGNGLVYDSEPFPEDIEITGYPKLVVWIAMDVPDTDFMVTLHEIKPDGTSIQLTDDALRARYRESNREEKLVTPGEITRYEFKQFWYFSRLLTKGSRLRLVFWSPNSIRLEKNYNSGGVVAEESGKDARTAHITLYHDSEHPSYVEIPVAKIPEAEKAARKAKARRLREIEAATIDQVTPNTKSEDDHNLQGEVTVSGDAFGGKYRGAHQGGWFSYDMKVLPERPARLTVTYWGGDTGNRIFDILIDGRRIVTQELTGSKPGNFIDVTCDVPADLTKGKQKVTVKFQPHPGATAGAVYGCRIMKSGE